MIDIDSHETNWKGSSVAWARGPRIRELSTRDREYVLARNHVGRVAFIGEGRVELMPIHYVFMDGVIIGRTAMGTKYLTWLTRGDVVFEVDESDGLFDWRSVVVRGTVTILRSRGTEAEQGAYAEAITALRTLLPDTMTPWDPTPFRGFIFAIKPTEITGRVATTR